MILEVGERGQCVGWERLLTPRQHDALEYYNLMWHARFVGDPVRSDWLVYDLGDSPWVRLKWNVSSQKLPGIRRNGGKLFLPSLGRWLMQKELLASMGLPIHPRLAATCGVPEWPLPRSRDGASHLGNMMHIPSVGCMLLTLFASARPR
jgi:hypothetical protein